MTASPRCSDCTKTVSRSPPPAVSFAMRTIGLAANDIRRLGAAEGRELGSDPLARDDRAVEEALLRGLGVLPGEVDRPLGDALVAGDGRVLGDPPVRVRGGGPRGLG